MGQRNSGTEEQLLLITSPVCMCVYIAYMYIRIVGFCCSAVPAVPLIGAFYMFTIEKG